MNRMRLRASRTFLVKPALPPVLQPLIEIAENLHWTWNTEARALFARVDPETWDSSAHNALAVIQHASPERLAQLQSDDGFLLQLRRVHEALRAYIARPPQISVPGTSSTEVVAYFSLEFALAESLPNYSGGLGVLAGDHLKSASDLGLPLVGVGLLYGEGYFQQVLAPDGWQHEEYQALDTATQPLMRVRDTHGEPLTVTVPFNGRDVSVAIWRLQVGKVQLILLDTDIDANSEADRAISGRLYGGDFETRIQQEMLLGIGGVRALHALGLDPAVCHMNEGHSALLGLERIRMLMAATGASFQEARLPVSAATAFTTHTAVAAGIDLFPPDLVQKHLGHYYGSIGLDDRAFLGLGRVNPDDPAEPFSMALLGLRLSGFRNGVSQLHGVVSRKLWDAAWPNLPDEEIPIGAITNGVHLPTWVSHEMGDVFDRYVGPQWRYDPSSAEQWGRVAGIPDSELWSTHERQRAALVARARQESTESALGRGEAPVDATFGQPLDPAALTIGFARRFAGYKRATLLFRDPARLAAIVNNPSRPVQFIFAGKAHPRDEPAKQLIREVLQFSQRPEFRDRIVLLERYDIDLARSLVQGCDVWLNTPLRPLEASGTSGMKAVANGALHCSVLDGWWYEAYKSPFGWAIGRDRVNDDPDMQDAFDSASLYDLLENEIVTSFYDRDVDGVPLDWVARMKGSIARYAPVFNTSRMVSDYAEQAYTPAAHSWQRLRQDQLAPARGLAAWLEKVNAAWPAVRVASIDDDAGRETSGHVHIETAVELAGLTAADVAVHVIHGHATADGGLAASAATPLEAAGESAGAWRFRGSFVPGGGGRTGYVIRILPYNSDLHDPFAAGLVRWS